MKLGAGSDCKVTSTLLDYMFQGVLNKPDVQHVQEIQILIGADHLLPQRQDRLIPI